MKIKTLIQSAGVLSVIVPLLSPVTATAQEQPYLGDVKIMGFNFCPRGWLPAEGSLVAIAQNQALFSLYGTMYGGDGRTTFGLPDFRGREVVNSGTGAGLLPINQGARRGSEGFNLGVAQMPQHSHAGGQHTHSYLGHGHTAAFHASTASQGSEVPLNNSMATHAGVNVYAIGSADGAEISSDSGTIESAASRNSNQQESNATGFDGAGQTYWTRSPYVAMKICVCSTVCIFPSRS